MQTGRKRKPTALKLILGNPGRRPLPAREPRPDTSPPAPPEWLTPEALAEWQRRAPELHRIGILTSIDAVAFGTRCQLVADYVAAQQKLARFGSVMRSSDSKKRAVISPFLRIRDRCLELLLKHEIEFGLTPSSRSRVTASPPVAEIDPSAKYLA